MYIDLFLNLSLLVALVVVSTFFERRFTTKNIYSDLLQGILFGTVAVIGMLKPMVILPGVLFDGRSVVISLCALFFGEIAVLPATIMATISRACIGGTGVYTGILAILISALIGLYFRRKRKRLVDNLSTKELLLFGVLVHVGVFLMMFTLPPYVIFPNAGKLAFGFLLIYPIATVLAGKILLDHRKYRAYLEDVETKNKELVTILESIADAVVVIDTQGKILQTNPCAEELLGISNSQGPEKHVSEFIKLFDEDAGKDIKCPTDEVLKSGKTIKFSGNTWLITNDGKRVPVYASIAPIKLDNGNIIGAILIFHDCTSERKVIEKLKESEAKYRTLIESGPAMIWTSGTDKLCNYFNPQWLSFRGRTLEQELGNGWTEGLHPEDYEHCLNTYTSAFDRREPFVMEYRIKRYDGVYRWIIDTGVPRYDSYGNFIGYIGYAFDNTEFIEAQKKINILLKAINVSGISVIITDENEIIQWVNASFTQLTGYSCDEVVGKNVRELLRSYLHDAEYYKNLDETLARGDIWEGERIDIRKDNTYFTVRSIIIPIKDNKGKIKNYVAIELDITKLKNLEQQLLHAQKMEILGTIVGAVIHEINNALSVLRLLLDDFRYNENLPANVTKQLTTMENSVNRAANVVKSLLSFSRKQPSSMKTIVDLNDVVQGMVKILQKLMGEKIRVRVRSLLKSAIVEGNYNMIDQAILNLAVNARDAMINGGQFEIEIDSVPAEELQPKPEKLVSDRYIKISISDTGAGIPPEIMPRIFEPFFTTKSPGKGTGLGLSIVKQIILDHNGYIDVQSEPGKGTTFFLYFPESKKPFKDVKALEKSMEKYTGTETILFVEDDRVIRDLITSILTQYNYKVITATNGNEALELLKLSSGNINLLLSDIALPGNISGYELFLEIRKINPAIKTILISGYPDEIEKYSDEFREGENILLKPISLNKLLESIRSTLDKKG